MKFEYIRKVDGEVNDYGNLVKTGDVVDLPDHLSEKALKRPEDYQVVEEAPVAVTDPEAKPKKRGRPKLNGNEG